MIFLILFCYQIFSSDILSPDYFEKVIRPIFNNRCIACHSCYDAPCQFNLQNYDGFARGANENKVYNGFRLKSTTPTRLNIDASSVSTWRNLNFFNVNNTAIPEKNIFYKYLSNKSPSEKDLPISKVEDVNYCKSDFNPVNDLFLTANNLKMPYGLPALKDSELKNIYTWIKEGAPQGLITTEAEEMLLRKYYEPEITPFENFLNDKNYKHILTARYIYEHLNLAHLYFKNKKNFKYSTHLNFFRLIRSKQECSKFKPEDEMASIRPSDPPSLSNFYYCLRPEIKTIVAKTHIPYELSSEKLNFWKKNFIDSIWEKKINLTSNSNNPFIIFQEIPINSRYQFLLEDALFMISTFIKGPVCNGQNAVNAIQEHFHVFFLSPKANKEIESQINGPEILDELNVPGSSGSNISLLKTIKINDIITNKRNQYIKSLDQTLKLKYPEGLSYQEIWNGGENHNPHAALTIFRHNDNAVVADGILGDTPKTVFVLSYSLFERLMYNLAVNFDVFGNIGHQTLTRIYMDLLRMEAEDLFLLFFPKNLRKEMRDSWYRGILTKPKLKYFSESLATSDLPHKIKFETKDFVSEWIQHATPPHIFTEKNSPLFAKIADTKATPDHPYPQFFPDVSLVIVKKENKASYSSSILKDYGIYSIIHNVEHENISWILAESLRLAPEEDSLTIANGILGFYPNQFFYLKENEIDGFNAQAKAIKNKNDYQNLVNKFGIKRTNPDFFNYYDIINEYYAKLDPLFFGYIDLTRYTL